VPGVARARALRRAATFLLALLLMAATLARSVPLPDGEPAPGISSALAAWRTAHLRDLRYAVRLQVADARDRMAGTVRITWRFAGRPVDLVLDWRPPGAPGVAGADVDVRAVNGTPRAARIASEHIVIGAHDLQPGENTVEIAFESPVAPAGTPVTRYRDRQDGSDYLYTLLVPSDASSFFPCIDQPDLKARFTLELIAPPGWTVIGNAPVAERAAGVHGVTWRFAPTAPISTYLFAFAAGPFVELREAGSDVGVYVRASKLEHAQREAGAVQRLNRAATRWFSDYFAQPFPFAKYDLVLLPEFAYGGMEHAGATFLREDAVLFPFEPAGSDLLRRAQLIFHETAHQWFGDLVTMRWFDDLWLKEGFANLMAFKAAQALLPHVDARNALRALKLSAYRTDVTQGTTPIWQALPNLSAAKSAYGSIVYSKAPAVLHQAEFYLGEKVFRAAVRDFLARHAYGAAGWADLVAAFERAAGRDLQAWARTWVEQRGVPEITVQRDAEDGGRRAPLRLAQHDALGSGVTWPQRIRVLQQCGDGGREVVDATLEEGGSVLPQACREQPAFVFANFEDRGYGIFLLDAASQAWLLERLPQVEDAFLRALLWDALWESVRRGGLAPARWVRLALEHLPGERDEITVSGLLGTLQTALRWYLLDAAREAVQPQVEAMLAGQMLQAASVSLRIAYFRAYVALARSPAALQRLERMLAGEEVIPGLVLRTAERYRVLRALLAAGYARADALLAQEEAADTSDDSRRLAFAARAARPDPAVKQRYFAAFLGDVQLPERWIEDSLPAFNLPEQDALTLPCLEQALRALPSLKRGRRIFFVNNWLGAFIGSQRSPRALETVEQFLRTAALDEDLRRKVLEAVDGLQRTVRIRAAQGEGG
jgi:aminopeptidase N